MSTSTTGGTYKQREGTVRARTSPWKRTRRLIRRTFLPTYLREIDRVRGMISIPEAKFLYGLARDVSQGCIVEVGSFRGRSTTALALGSMAGRALPVFAIDPHEPFTGVSGYRFGPEDRAGFFASMLKTGSYRIVRLVNLSSEVIAPGWSAPVGLLWIDGDHAYASVKRDFDCWRPFLTNDATVVFDDATKSSLGPFRLIAELLHSGGFIESVGTGKIRVLTRTPEGGT